MRWFNNFSHGLNGLKVAAYTIWGIVGLVTFSDGDSATAVLLPFIALWVVFLVGMQCVWWEASRYRPVEYWGMGLMCMALIGLGLFSADGFHLVLLVVLASILPFRLSLRRTLLVVLLTYLFGLITLFLRWPAQLTVMNFVYYCSYLSFAGFGLFASLALKRETDAREELVLVNRQLRATQQLLTDNALQDERLRISRDLHDTLGHHLTALNLQLEVARKLSSGNSLDHVEQAQAIAKLLLSDVREVVSDMRNGAGLNLNKALVQLMESAKAKSTLTIDKQLHINDPRVSETLFRSIQEIVTNSNRHSRTGELHIRLDQTDNQWRLSADHGDCAPLTITEGAGILGMRERVAKLGGEFIQDCHRGLVYHITLPRHD